MFLYGGVLGADEDTLSQEFFQEVFDIEASKIFSRDDVSAYWISVSCKEEPVRLGLFAMAVERLMNCQSAHEFVALRAKSLQAYRDGGVAAWRQVIETYSNA